MLYEVEFKSFGYVSAKNPRNAQKIVRNNLRDIGVFMVEPTFKIKAKHEKPRRGKSE